EDLADYCDGGVARDIKPAALVPGFPPCDKHSAALYPGPGVPALASQGKQHVIGPFAVDLQVILGKALFLEAILLKDATAGDVMRQKCGLETMEAQGVEEERQDNADGFRHEAATGELFTHPVAEVGVLGGAPADIGDGEAANQCFARGGLLENQEREIGAAEGL